MNKLKE